jgi:hypothetical protein
VSRALRIKLEGGKIVTASSGHQLITPDFEPLLAFQMRCAGLPEPERQLQFIRGRKFTADFAWRAARFTDGLGLVVEVQGGIWRRRDGAHSGGAAIERDIEKLQLALLNGWQVFPVTTDQVKRGEAVQLIELALRAKGWKP